MLKSLATKDPVIESCFLLLFIYLFIFWGGGGGGGGDST